ncbi:MAG: TIM-barrel domain-containing protein [Bacilli bacterium]
MYDLGENFRIDIKKSKTPNSYVFRGSKYRISIISDSLIRFEYNEDGKFNDYPTMFASNRSFGKPKINVEEDNLLLVIRNEKFTIEYQKDKPFIGNRMFPEQYLKVVVKGSDKVWYFNHPEVRNFQSTAYSLDEYDGSAQLDKGLFSLDGFASIDDSKTPILNLNGNLMIPSANNIDTYLFIYNEDFGIGLRDYFNLTGMPPLIPRYALGVWWSKNESYNVESIQNLVNSFRKNRIPFSVIMLGDYARTKNKYSPLSFTLDKNIFPSTFELSKYLHQNNIFIGTNIKTDGVLSIEEENHNEFIKIYTKDTDKNIPINVYNANLMDAFLKGIINPFMNLGIDFLWIDDNDKNNRLRNFAMNYYLFNNNSSEKYRKRNLIISRNFGVVPHKYSILYSGKLNINWKTLKYLPFYNANSSNIGVSWWSHDIGGYKGGTEDSELYMRYVQLGVYSPILRLSSEGGKYYKREPWRWDAKTSSIVEDYLILRHKLIPYLYSEAKKYSTFGTTLVQPLYYKYPETYDEPLYKNEYYFGSELFVSPIVTNKDSVMNRVVHRLFLPKGIWYDFKTGKKFMGGKRYVTFFKDEDYPVFARQGAIIPMAVLNPEKLNDTSSPKKLEVHIFPGRSNTYKLYEDDGYTQKYKDGYSFTTEINYYYKENDFSVSLEPFEGKPGVIPEKRNYVIRFRNTKFTDQVQVFCDEINVPYRRYIEDNDFVIEFDNIPTSSKVFVYCKGKDIEIDASRLINEDLESIISDLMIPTELKIEIDKIIFSDMSIKDKRISIRKLRRKGLSSIFIKMFLRLFEYIQEV